MSEGPPERRERRLLARISEVGTSAQSAIPGLYAWAITVAPAAWSRGAPLGARIAAVVGVVALTTAPLVESAARRHERGATVPGGPLGGLARVAPAWTGATWARAWSVWGFVLSSAVVWALAPAALSAARFDGVRGVLGVAGWALFAFASAGPALRADPEARSRIVAGSSLKPRSDLPRGDGVYVALGVAMALAMQAVGWDVASPERAVLVRLVTVACGVAVVGATTAIALARHTPRVPARGRVRLRRTLPWLVVLALFLGAGAFLAQLR